MIIKLVITLDIREIFYPEIIFDNFWFHKN